MISSRSSIFTLILAGLTGRNVFKLVTIPDTISKHDHFQAPAVDAVTAATEEINPPSKVNETSSFAGCLLWKDDNHHLVEWLAYNYQQLPLRRLILAVDPMSRTSPKHILDRYTSRGLMDIDLWNDTDVFPPEVLERRRPLDKLNGKQTINLHRYRQQTFMQQCMLKLHEEQKWTWVSLVDNDEFILPNRFARKDLKFSDDLTGRQSNTTIFELLEIAKTTMKDAYVQSPCVPINRVRFGPRKSAPFKVQREVPAGFTGYEFMTHRYRWHYALNDGNGLAKMFIDLSRLNTTDIAQHTDVNPHRPVKAICRSGNMFIQAKDAAFIAHHYSGTEEHWNFRLDARREAGAVHDPETFNKMEKRSVVENDSARGWLSQLVANVGEDTAKELVKGSGHVLHPSHFAHA